MVEADEKVFDRKVRSSTAPSGANESTYQFFDRIGLPWFGRVRETIEEWCSTHPREERRRVVRELRSGDDQRWRGAFWELYLYRVLLGLGYAPVCHPRIASKRRPDFRLTHNEQPAYLEAQSLTGSRIDTGRDRQRRQVEAAIEDLHHPSWSVWLEFETEGTELPGLGSIKSRIARWLEGLRVPTSDVGSMAEWPPCVVEDAGWKIRLRASPKPYAALGDLAYPTIIGRGPSGMKLSRDAAMLRRSISRKGPRYGDLHAPLVVAVRYNHSFVDDEDVMNALYGSIAVRLTYDGRGEIVNEETVRNADGAWRGPHGWQNTRVSAVLVARGLCEATVLTSTPEVWLHTAARYPFEVPLPFPTRRVDLRTGAIAASGPTVTRPMNEILGLPANWPGPGDPWARDS